MSKIVRKNAKVEDTRSWKERAADAAKASLEYSKTKEGKRIGCAALVGAAIGGAVTCLLSN